MKTLKGLIRQMKFEFNKRYATIGLYAFLVLACAALFWSFLSNLRYFRGFLGTITQLLRPFIYGFGIAYILNPLLKWSERVLARISHHRLSDKPKRALGISLTYLIAAGFITLFIMMMSPLLDSINQLIGPLKTFLMTADQWIPELLKYLPADFDLPKPSPPTSNNMQIPSLIPPRWSPHGFFPCSPAWPPDC